MGMILVHESCHVKQTHDLTWRFYFMSRNAVEKECHTAAIDVLKQIDAPQEMIDWNQDIIDRYNNS
jgi:hypothetical protein